MGKKRKILLEIYFFTHPALRSIVSRYNGTSSGGECGTGSSFRCNNPQQQQQWPGAYYPANSVECASSTPHHIHGHQHHFPPQYNGFHHHPQSSTNSNGNVLPPHGKLQKSLSFAFTTPMMNEAQAFHPSCQNQLNSFNYPDRSYSR